MLYSNLGRRKLSCLLLSGLCAIGVVVSSLSPSEPFARADYPPTAAYAPLSPARLLDTRPGLATVDGQSSGIGARSAGSVTSLHVAGRGGVAGDATAAVLSVTVTEATSPGFVTVFPCGSATPNASNVNYGIGTTVATAVISKIGTNGDVCLFSYGSTHIAVDVNGYFPADALRPPITTAPPVTTAPPITTAPSITTAPPTKSLTAREFAAKADVIVQDPQFTVLVNASSFAPTPPIYNDLVSFGCDIPTSTRIGTQFECLTMEDASFNPRYFTIVLAISSPTDFRLVAVKR